MTRQDYEFLAEVLRDTAPVAGPGITRAELLAAEAQRVWTATVLANRLRATNPRFDSRHFLVACWVVV